MKNHEELTLDNLVLLSHAVSHGCKAGQSEEVLTNLYKRQIFPAYGKDLYSHFSSNNMEAIVDLGIISSFFESPWDKPVDELSTEFRLYILDAAYLRLESLGAETEARQTMQARLKVAESIKEKDISPFWHWYDLIKTYDRRAEEVELTKLAMRKI